ncbi:tetratricopeptide repeat protein [Veronia nyctiphanis]|nr:tetratricopeptide repeat protein [Veronia nyctiphanis]
MNETTSENAMTLDQAFQHGVSLYQQKQPLQAREVFEQILHHAPDSVAVLQILCVLDMEDGKFDAAISRLDAALEVEPENLSVWFDKANLLHQLGITKMRCSLLRCCKNRHRIIKIFWHCGKSWPTPQEISQTAEKPNDKCQTVP